MRYFTVFIEWSNNSNPLYATLENSIHSAIYTASSFLAICNKNCMHYYKTGVIRVTHIAELVNTYISAIKIIVLSSCF